MKLVKMFGVAALATMATMAFVGVGTASAVNKTVLCKAAPNASGVCENENYYKGGQTENQEPTANATQIHSQLQPETKAILKIKKSILGEQKVICQKSEVGGHLKESIGQQGKSETQLGVQISELKFEECTSGFNGKPCTAEAVQLPYQALVTQDLESIGNGNFEVFEKPEQKQPGARVFCENFALGIKVDCTYKVAEAQKQAPEGTEVGNFRALGGAQAKITTGPAGASTIQLKQAGPNCLGSEPQWESKYNLHFIQHEPEEESTAGWVAHVVQ